MSKKIYNKLVRDKIPEIIEQDNATCKTRILDEEEYVVELLKKLNEEVEEVVEAKSEVMDLIKEISDVYEVLEAIVNYYEIEKSDIFELQKERRQKRGGFKKRIYLEYIVGGTY